MLPALLIAALVFLSVVAFCLLVYYVRREFFLSTTQPSSQQFAHQADWGGNYKDTFPFRYETTMSPDAIVKYSNPHGVSVYTLTGF
jgi:hypothetical protein